MFNTNSGLSCILKYCKCCSWHGLVVLEWKKQVSNMLSYLKLKVDNIYDMLAISSARREENSDDIDDKPPRSSIELLPSLVKY